MEPAAEREATTVTYIECDHEGQYAWWARDAQGIELCKVCDRCEDAKLSQYPSWVLEGYTQSDIDEPIESDY